MSVSAMPRKLPGRRTSLPMAKRGLIPFVAAGTALCAAGMTMMHQAGSDPDVGWYRKSEFSNLRSTFSHQYKLWSPTVDYTSLTRPEGNVSGLNKIVKKED